MIVGAEGPGFIYAEGKLFGKREVVGFGLPAFQVREMDRKEAIRIIVANHYSRTHYRASRIHLGVYADGLKGVLQFGAAMNPASQGSVVAGTGQDEYLELNRMWLDDALPRNSESRAVSYAVKYIRAKHPRIAWIQSFADERCGRYGVVYQACNFVYCGEHTSVFWELDGTFYHNSIMTRRARRSPREVHLQENKHRAIAHQLRQFRYLYFLRKGFRERLRLQVKPYPKPSTGECEACPTSSSPS